MSSFKIQYNNDPDFRKRHKEYMNGEVKCEVCNQIIKRYNKSHHKKTERHRVIAKMKENNEFNEIWRKIKGFPEYEISNLGFVKNKKTGKILTIKSNGFSRIVVFYKNGEVITHDIDKLMKTYFPDVVNPPEEAYKYRGITSPSSGKYVARIKIKNKLYHLGTYTEEQEALFMYNYFAAKNFKNAILNDCALFWSEHLVDKIIYYENKYGI